METRETLRFELIMDAGNGAQKAGDILIKAFATDGNYVYIEPIIPAEISPPKRTPYSMSGVVIRLSENDINCIGSETELLLAEHEILLNRRLDDSEYAKKAHILLDMGDSKQNPETYQEVIKRTEELGLQLIKFEMNDETLGLIRELNGNGKNMFYLGVYTAILNAPLPLIEKTIRDTFKKLPEDKLAKNLKIYENGFACGQQIGVSYKVPKAAEVKDRKNTVLLDGNTAIALGMIDAGIKLYCGYPITPASSIMHTLAKLFPQYGGLVHQAEDEISAIGAAVGGYYAGVPAATGTSGPGLSLKQEFIGFATASEIPLILIDVQRGGPSTGLPTRTEQSDLPTAIFGCHGDNTKVVISVGDVKDCFYVPHVARYLTEKLRVPVVIMSDYQTSVSYKIIDEGLKLNEMELSEDIEDWILDLFRLKRLPDDIEMVKHNQSIPGEPDKMRRISGLNTNERGEVVYSSSSAIRAHKVRNEKLHHVARVLQAPEIIGADSGDVLIVGWGSTRGVIEESVTALQKDGVKASGLHLKVVNPLPLMLKDIFSRFKRIRTIELAYGDALKPAPLAMILRNQTLVDVTSLIAEPSGRPIKPSDVVSKTKELV